MRVFGLAILALHAAARPLGFVARQPVASRSLRKRLNPDYVEVFPGLDPGPDASIEGTGYLTFTVLPDTTYDIDGCLSFCSSVQGCGASD